MRSAWAQRRASGGTPTFWTTTSFSRPSPGSPSAAYTAGWTMVPFNSSSGLSSALSSLAAKQYIYYSGPGALPTSSDFALGTFYNGSGTLSVTSASTHALKIANKNPATATVLDFGAPAQTGNTNWGVSTTTNYVKFSYTGTTNGFWALYIQACSNLNIFGGDYTGGLHSDSVSFYGPSNNIYLYDAYIHDVGGCGINMHPITSGGAAADLHNIQIRAEVNRYSMNPALDPHTDKGSGLHGAILHAGAGGGFYNNTLTVYGHDPLKPGEVSNGITWPEGGGGSVIEAGQSSGTYTNNTYYAYGLNCLMVPNGTNPGSTASQFGGTVMALFGGASMSGMVIGWAEGNNTSGAVVFGDGSGAWSTGTLTVSHGRHTNTNQSTAGSNIAIPYDNRFGIIYNDCT